LYRMTTLDDDGNDPIPMKRQMNNKYG
jgi:hypothetical protein